MTQTITPDLAGINEAGKLVLELDRHYWRLRVNTTKRGDFPEELVRNVERLEVLLKKPNVGGVLSLKNPYPVKIAFFWSVSYSRCVCDMFKSKLDGYCWDRDDLPEDNAEILLQCIKEVERATGVPCNADLVEEARLNNQVRTRNRERDDWVIEQCKKKNKSGEYELTYKEIREGIPKQNKNWNPIENDQGIIGILKRRGLWPELKRKNK
jgi:hypothetical protein